MLTKYRRQSRNASELGLGGLKPLNDALPELRGWAAPAAHQSAATRLTRAFGSSPSRTRTGKPLPARDFKSPASAIPPRGQNSPYRAGSVSSRQKANSRELVSSDDAEARTGFEPAYDGFANRCLTTWLPRRKARVRYNAGRVEVHRKAR